MIEIAARGSRSEAAHAARQAFTLSVIQHDGAGTSAGATTSRGKMDSKETCLGNRWVNRLLIQPCFLRCCGFT